MKGDIPNEVRRFLIQHIDSTEQLEVLLATASDPDRSWTAEAVYNVVKTNPASIANHLQEFCRRGLLQLSKERDAAYRFAPPTRETSNILTMLEEIYRHKMHRVIDIIYSKPSTAVQSFADAFRLRKD